MRLQAFLIRHNPDLQEVHRVARRWIELAVHHSRPGGHILELAWANYSSVAHGILVLELAAQDVRNDLHVTMGMSIKTTARADDVIVDDPQGPEAHMLRIVIV